MGPSVVAWVGDVSWPTGWVPRGLWIPKGAARGHATTVVKTVSVKPNQPLSL